MGSNEVINIIMHISRAYFSVVSPTKCGLGKWEVVH